MADPDAVVGLIEAAIERFGRLDIVVNNAGAARGEDRVPVVELSLEAWNKVLHTNLTGAFLVSQAAARQMTKDGRGGCIVNISSIASRVGAAHSAAYASSKAGLNALSRVMAAELAQHRIRVNAVLPGVIETSRMDDLGRGEGWRKLIEERIPLGTAGNGMEVAYLATFLCSDMASWITGQDLAVDGGTSWR